MPLALRMLWRDWRGGELRLLALAVVVAVAAVTSVAWLAERVAGATAVRAADLLAADRVAEFREPVDPSEVERVAAFGLDTALTAEFPTILVSGDETRLVSAKAVSSGYPLRGELRIRDDLASPEQAVRDTPQPGQAWLEPRLLALLDLEVGERITIGDRELVISRLLTLEPDRGGFFFSLAPRVLFNHADLDATGLLGPGSRVRYRLLMAGDDRPLQRAVTGLRATHGDAVEIETATDDRRGVSEVVEQARRFLGLAALLTVIVAGVAVLLTVRHYAERQVTGVAVMRAAGATRAQISRLIVGKLFWLGLLAGLLGALIGFGIHALMIALVRDLIGVDVPAPGLRPLITGWITAFAALLGFALPTLLRLRNVPPMRVLRRDLGVGLFRGGLPLVAAIAVILGLMAWQAGDWRLTLYVFGALAGTLAVLGVVAGAVVALVRSLYRRGGSGRLLWLTGLTRRPWTAVVQIVAIGVGLMALFLLAVVRSDLLDTWRDQIPPDAPNLFLINIQPDELDGVRDLLAGEGITTDFSPMIRGRLVALNDSEVSAEDYSGARAQRLVRREFNLSWAAQPRADNRVVAGQWWSGQEPDRAFSVEADLADTLGIGVGDRISFDVAGERVSAEVANLREVRWDSFDVNFFVLGSPGTLDGMPATWITSFHLPEDRQALLARLVREYPSVTAFDVSAILRTATAIIDQGARVVELMALLTLIAGVLVLLAALQVTGEERRFESALLRALGATGRRIAAMARVEFWLVGALAGLIAGLVASLAGMAVADGLFDLAYPFRPGALLLGALVGLMTVWIAGALGARRYYRVSPMRLLREGAE